MGERPNDGAKTKNRPAWLTGDSPKAGRSAAPRRQTGRPSPGKGATAPGGVPLAEEQSTQDPTGNPTGDLAREYLDKVDRDTATQGLRDEAGSSGEGRLAAAREWVAENRALALAAGVAMILLVVGLRACAGGDVPRQQGQGTSREPSGQAAPAPGGVQNSGLVFSGLKEKDGVATLDAGELHWDGRVSTGEQGETVTLQGPTAAQVERGFELPKSSVESGTFAVAQEEGPVIHVDTHTYRAGETEVTLGSLFAIEDDVLEDYGFYVDERGSGSEEVVRTYFDPDGGTSYAVSFMAPKGTPVPLLVGWRGPGTGSGSEDPTD